MNYTEVRKEFILAFLGGRKSLHELENKYKFFRGTLRPILTGKKYAELRTIMALAQYYKCRLEEARSIFEPISPSEFEEIRKEINKKEPAMTNNLPRSFSNEKVKKSSKTVCPLLEENIYLRESGQKDTEKIINFCNALDITVQHYYSICRGDRRLSITKADALRQRWGISANEVSLILGPALGFRPHNWKAPKAPKYTIMRRDAVQPTMPTVAKEKIAAVEVDVENKTKEAAVVPTMVDVGVNGKTFFKILLALMSVCLMCGGAVVGIVYLMMRFFK